MPTDEEPALILVPDVGQVVNVGSQPPVRRQFAWEEPCIVGIAVPGELNDY